MNVSRKHDWDPRADSVLEDQCQAYDEMRRRCPVAHSEFLGHSLFSYDDVLRVLLDHQTFSNAASQHRSVPNGMDPPEHTAYRELIEPYFGAEKLKAFEPVCRKIASDLLRPLVNEGAPEYVEQFAVPYALRCQCTFLGWPEELAAPLRAWTRKNHQATLAGDRIVMAELAQEFRSYVDDLLARRRHPESTSPQDDVLAGLLQARVHGEPLRDDDIASILRNWTVGEIGSIASALSTITHHFATDHSLQDSVRANRHLLPTAIEEVLRISGPLVANRRVATRDVEIGGRHIAAGERLSLIWIAANRDEKTFEEPLTVRFDRNPHMSLLYGAGIHVCPGAPWARLEMRVAIEELLNATHQVRIAPDTVPRKVVYPANGFAELHVRLQ